MLTDDNMVMKKKEHVIERHGEELLLFDSINGKLFETNDTGKSIWIMLDGKHTVRQIKEKLKEEFEFDSNLDVDVSNFLNKLAELGLIDKI